jgi:hypothetical protein
VASGGSLRWRYAPDPATGETIDSNGTVLIEEIDRHGATTGAHELLLPFEFDPGFSQNLPVQ